jgi:predicted O-linked N-acetylglucosamine transferase (SPINDLY family)/thioredoxin-like negative regulator of GroEL
MLKWIRRHSVKPSPTPVQPDDSEALDVETLRARGKALLAAGELAGAAACFVRVVARGPADATALTSLGYIRMQQQLSAEAADLLSRAVDLDPTAHDAHYMLGTLHECAGDLGKALNHLTRAVEAAPTFDLAMRDLSRVLFKAGRPADARTVLERGIATNARFADYHFYLGNVHWAAGDARLASASYADAVAVDPAHLNALVQLGAVLVGMGDASAAEAALQRALVIDPGNALALAKLGNAHTQLGRLEAAVADYQASIAADPMYAEPWSGLGNVLRVQGSLADAERSCRRALEIDPDLAVAHNNLGNALVDLGRAAEALGCYDRAVALRPAFADALANKGHALNVLRRSHDAVSAYQQALAIDADSRWLFGAWLHTRMGLCDWRGIHEAFVELGRRVDRGERAATPFTVLATPLNPAQQLRCAKTFAESMAFADVPAMAAPRPKERIRLGYFSADFHDHATAFLMAELFELHDRGRFEVCAFSFGPPSSHPMRARLEAGFDHFFDAGPLSDAAICERSRALEIDIAIDLKGFTEGSRPAIFARRAAPLQVSYMGFPGTMGSPFIDYLIADSHVIPSASVAAYTEKIVFLPHSYQVNDRRREVSEHHPTRASVGLPDRAFVFCCFNNNYKITPDVFAVWMSLLREVKDSVLWLLGDAEHVVANLRAEASASGIDNNRLIFAPRVGMGAHLARQRLADLFLDTFYCNAHTTASDALWVGLPLITCSGQTFASRVAGSLLHAAGLGELAVDCVADYERLALNLPHDRARLSALRARLARNIPICPLFDTRRTVSALEQAYETMLARRIAGLPPDHIHVPA